MTTLADSRESIGDSITTIHPKGIKEADERSGKGDAFVLGLVMSTKVMRTEAGVVPHTSQKALLATGER